VGLVTLAVIAGLVMVVCTGGEAGPGGSAVGFALLVVGVPVLAVGQYLLSHLPPAQGRARAVALGASALLVAGVSASGAMASVAGQAVRWADPADYTGRWGTRVTVDLPDSCDVSSTRYLSSGLEALNPDVVCTNSSWKLGGTTHRGTVVLSDDEMPLIETATTPKRVEAYVIGDKGYSVKRIGTVESVAAWGGVPLWGLIGLPVALLCARAMRSLGWRSRPRPPRPVRRSGIRLSR
jgi:hypothetical protein